ncbi:AraC family transcriptional regulator [Speluncibacter jeojiensis]|uniref:AraC family transcriptional regulator n=1 Tax=Speluncibacter jeojiensis TaxID=2710754 RepID=A0A9X4RCY2_9ACTN|nr:AraC family transcriptional regulator [Corynebacteriales bacterium D3-21]
MASTLETSVIDHDFPRSGTGVAVIAQFALDHGMPVGAALLGTGLTLDRLDDPELQVTAGQELTVVRNVLAHLSDRAGIGLELGRRYRVSTFGIFGYACLTSPTFGDALAFALRYFDLTFSFCVPVVEVGADVVTARIVDDRVPADVRQFLLERDLAAIFTVVGDFYPGGIPLSIMRLRCPAPPHADRFAAVFGIEPQFGRDQNVLAFDASILGAPLPQASRATRAACEQQCRAMLAQRRHQAGIAAQVRDRLIRIDTIPADMERVAAELAMSTRTLRRRLADEGTSYRTLRDEVRQALAERLLATGALSVDEIALRLGYAEASSFIHAFTRWKGTTPARHRR